MKPNDMDRLNLKLRHCRLSAYRKQAAAEGLSLSEWARQCMDAFLPGELQLPDEPKPGVRAE